MWNSSWDSCHQQAFDLATYCEYPSIGFMLGQGVTDIWEYFPYFL